MISKAIEVVQGLEISFRSAIISGDELARFYRVSAMKIAIFGIVSKTFAEKLFARNAAFAERSGNVLSGF